MIPDYVTHYHLPDRAPFLNLSELDEPELTNVMHELSAKRRALGRGRKFGQPYIELRRLTERRMRELFVARGGRPQREGPHYFVLGVCDWFRNLYPEMSEVRISLDELSTDATSITYPDSFTAMGFGPQFGLPDEPRPYHGRVFLLDELARLVDKFGLPDGSADDDYTGFEKRPFEKYIEVQLWTDEPVADRLRKL